MKINTETRDSLYVENLSTGYGSTLIIDNQSMLVPKGKITCLIGPNGCGKSTLLKTIGRVIKPRSGHIYLEGNNVLKADPKVLATQMAFLPQAPQAPGGLTVRELVAYGRYPYQKMMGTLSTKDYEMVAWAITETGLSGFEDRHLEDLSGGQRQRAWIAMALCQDTPYLLLDEPTTYLDLAHQLEVLELLKKLNETAHKTIVMVIHELNQAARFADYIVGMRDGKILYSGTPQDVIANEPLKALFHIDANVVADPEGGYPVCMSYQLVKTVA